MGKPTLFYCNPLFDLSLGNYPLDPLKRAAAEMTTLFVPCVKEGDYILLDVETPQEYWDYCQSKGMVVPRAMYKDSTISSTNGNAWGWNDRVVEKLKACGASCNHPDLSIIKQVNSRSYGYLLNKKLNSGVPDGELFSSLESLLSHLNNLQPIPIVLKPLYGNAGYGFIRKQTPHLSESEIAQVTSHIKRDRAVLFEPWLNRIYDLSSRCYISKEGQISGIRHHRTLSNRAGAFFADWIDPEDPLVSLYHQVLDQLVFKTAKQLFNDHYWGPVGFDSFVWKDSIDQKQLAGCIEINARHPMSTVAYALYDRLAPNTVATFRFISKRRHRLPETYEKFEALLGSSSFNPKTNEGVLLVSPLRVSHGDGIWKQPERSAFFITATSSKKLEVLDHWLREILSPPKK